MGGGGRSPRPPKAPEAQAGGPRELWARWNTCQKPKKRVPKVQTSVQSQKSKYPKCHNVSKAKKASFQSCKICEKLRKSGQIGSSWVGLGQEFDKIHPTASGKPLKCLLGSKTAMKNVKNAKKTRDRTIPVYFPIKLPMHRPGRLIFHYVNMHLA